MRKLMMAIAVAAMAGGVFADGEAAPAAKAASAAKAEAPAKAEAASRRPARPAFNREQFMARMKERQAERRAKVAELLKSAGVAEDKVQPLVDELEKVFSPRSQRPRRGGKAGGGQKAAPAAK